MLRLESGGGSTAGTVVSPAGSASGVSANLGSVASPSKLRVSDGSFVSPAWELIENLSVVTVFCGSFTGSSSIGIGGGLGLALLGARFVVLLLAGCCRVGRKALKIAQLRSEVLFH